MSNLHSSQPPAKEGDPRDQLGQVVEGVQTVPADVSDTLQPTLSEELICVCAAYTGMLF